MLEEIIQAKKLKKCMQTLSVSASEPERKMLITVFTDILKAQMSIEPIVDYKELLTGNTKRLKAKEFLAEKIKIFSPAETFKSTELSLVSLRLDTSLQKLVCIVSFLEERVDVKIERSFSISIRLASDIPDDAVMDDHRARLSEFLNRVEPWLCGTELEERVERLRLSLL